MNILEIFGNLGADPEVRVTANGTKVTTLRVATKVRRGKEDTTLWWRVTVWGTQFDKLISYLKKGSSIIVVGEMGKPEIYVDKMGQQQVSLQMTAEFLRFNPFGRSDGQSSSQNSFGQQQQQPQQQNYQQQQQQQSRQEEGDEFGQEEAFAGTERADSDDSMPF